MAQNEEIIIDIYNDGVVPVVGGDIGWNQLIENGNFASSSGWGANRATLSVANNKATLTMAATASATSYIKNDGVASALVEGHKYLVSAYLTASKNTSMRFTVAGNGSASKSINANTRTYCYAILTKGTTQNGVIIYVNYGSELVEGDTVIVENVQCFDLTEFDATFEQSIYSLERANAGAGIALFNTLFPSEYYAYNAGEIRTLYLQ